MDSTEALKIGDQVKVVARSHPWFDAIGRISERFHSTSPDHWVVELETILPGHRAMAHESELRRV